MFSPMPAESVQTDALEERIQQRVGARVRELRQAAFSVKILARVCRVFDRPVGYLFQNFDEMRRMPGTLTTVKGPENAGIQWFAEEERHLADGVLALMPCAPLRSARPPSRSTRSRTG